MTTPRAKIVCTLGPASNDPATIRALIAAGMDVARFNFSHGTHEEHLARYRAVREASDATGRAVGVLADLQGPKIRLGLFTGGRAVLQDGQEFVITTDDVPGDSKRVSTTYPALARDVKAGETLLIDDGLVRLEVLATDGRNVRTRVIEGGVVSDHKGLNLPGVAVSAPALTGKDLEDLAFAMSLRVDVVALSFVRSVEDAAVARAAMDRHGARLPLIAKLEKPEAVRDLAGIVDAFDGLMVARGDLGVELPLEDVPLVQKHAVQLARERAKPVIVATQMLESMIEHPRPTRAEASDVANAVLDGADALMLSGETAVGQHVVEAVETMARIIAATEGEGLPRMREVTERAPSVQQSIAAAAARVGGELSASALVAFTSSGSTARSLASHREPIPLLAFTSDPAVRSQLCLTWGVETFVVPGVRTTDEMVQQVDRAMVELERGERGDCVVIVAGTPPGTPGSTNTLRVHRLGAA